MEIAILRITAEDRFATEKRIYCQYLKILFYLATKSWDFLRFDCDYFEEFVASTMNLWTNNNLKMNFFKHEWRVQIDFYVIKLNICSKKQLRQPKPTKDFHKKKVRRYSQFFKNKFMNFCTHSQVDQFDHFD